MRSTTPASSNPRRRKASIAVLLALCALAAGVQALAPASAGAVANQQTDCRPSGVPGLGTNPKTGVTCILAGSGIEVVEIEGSPALCPTPSNCLARGPLHAGPGGGGGSEAGSGEGSGRWKGIPGAQSESPRAEKEARKQRLAEMDPQERKLKRALCAVIDSWKARVYMHMPSFSVSLPSYAVRKRAAEKIGAGFERDRNRERELPEYEPYERMLDRFDTLSEKAECWLF